MKTAIDFFRMISYGCGCCDGRSTEEIDKEIISVIEQAMEQARKEALEDMAGRIKKLERALEMAMIFMHESDDEWADKELVKIRKEIGDSDEG